MHNKRILLQFQISGLDTATFQKVEVEASFPGGEAAWNKYIQSILEQNIDKLSKRKTNFGTCEVQFIVDKDGSVRYAEALTMQKSLLAELLIKAIKNGPKWTPAYQFGKTVKAWRRQKVTLKAPE
ncbi:MAG: energy transducer TonB [Chitinophagaceae bacterium]|nr:energy transducer TonB [Chitinophagaceae bacterium]